MHIFHILQKWPEFSNHDIEKKESFEKKHTCIYIETHNCHLLGAKKTMHKM